MHQVYNSEVFVMVPLLTCILTLPSWAKKVHKPSLQSFWPPLKREIAHLDAEKWLKPSRQTFKASPPLPPNRQYPLEWTTLKKGLPYFKLFAIMFLQFYRRSWNKDLEIKAKNCLVTASCCICSFSLFCLSKSFRQGVGMSWWPELLVEWWGKKNNSRNLNSNLLKSWPELRLMV